MNILITGGASGLGKVITEQLCNDANNHIFFTFNKSSKSAKIICSKFSNCTGINCDFSNKSSLDALVHKLDNFNLDVLINNFYDGVFLYKHFHKIHPNEFLNGFVKNIIPTISITQSVIKSFRKRKKGKIITILSDSLTDTPIGTSIYVCNKSYLNQMVKVWNIENKSFGIESVSINPGLMNTSLTSKIDPRFKGFLLKKGETMEENIKIYSKLVVKSIMEGMGN